MSQIRLLALLLTISMAVVCIQAASQQKARSKVHENRVSREDRARKIEEIDTYELVEAIKEVEQFGRNQRRGRQLGETLGSVADVAQIASLVIRLAQVLYTAFQYMAAMTMSIARTNSGDLVDFAADFLPYAAPGLVSLVRSYNYGMGDSLQNFLLSMDIL